MAELYLGLMSGTSMDGVDGALVDLSGSPLTVLAHASAPLPSDLKRELLALNQVGHNELHRAALAANRLMTVYAGVVRELCRHPLAQVSPIVAVGAHGQTVRHQPQSHGSTTGYTIQLCNPALLAELTGLDVVADFRSRDVAAGGQGAPLVPVFHQAVFGQPDTTVAVLNVGGMANLTVITPPPQPRLTGFDCGLGNVLMDAWCHQHQGQDFDRDGAWAASGSVHAPLLQELLSEPYFSQLPPKSTGRDLFHMGWLNATLTHHPALKPQDVQATLLETTARSCAADVQRHASASQVLIVCGGGALNGQLMRRLQALLPQVHVRSSEAHGLPPMQVEAAAFAWLARKTMRREPLALETITGAQGARVAGAVYPA